MERDQTLNLEVDGEIITLSPEDMEIIAEDIPGWAVANKDSLTVALDISISPELQDEGNAREFVNRIQKIRKDANFELTDRIVVQVEKNDNLKTSITNFYSYICAEILADSIGFIDDTLDSGVEIEVNEIIFKVQVLKKI
jgi:isoleucyl-tRNA synthetase